MYGIGGKGGGVCEEDIKGFRLIYRCVKIFYYNKWINIRKNICIKMIIKDLFFLLW